MANEPILEGSITGVWSYLLSVDWEEPWLYILISFHVWCILATLLSLLYRYYYPQIALFLVYLCLAFSSEYLNIWAADNYKLFSGQQYFDSQGMFISLVFSFPLLCNTLVIVVYWMWDLTQSMINLKRSKLRQTMKVKDLVADKVKTQAESGDKFKQQDSKDLPDGEKDGQVVSDHKIVPDGEGDGQVGDGEKDGQVGDGEKDGQVGDGEKDGQVGDGEKDGQVGDGEKDGQVGDGEKEGEVGDGEKEGEVGDEEKEGLVVEKTAEEKKDD